MWVVEGECGWLRANVDECGRMFQLHALVPQKTQNN